MADYKQLCAELVSALAPTVIARDGYGPVAALLPKARAALAEPETEGPTPQPVPVSERLPEAGDCDAEGRCWCFAYDGSVHGWALRIIEPNVYDTHWLPAHALPVAE